MNKYDKLNKNLDSKKGYFFLAVLLVIDEKMKLPASTLRFQRVSSWNEYL